jgi:hypothetical protein
VFYSLANDYRVADKCIDTFKTKNVRLANVQLFVMLTSLGWVLQVQETDVFPVLPCLFPSLLPSVQGV